MVELRRTKNPIERFESRFEPEPNTGCWLWKAGVDAYGYGQFSVRKKKIKAHRFAFTVYRAPIPDGLDLDHLCRQRLCVNPEHMEPVTRRVNVGRGVGVCAKNAAKTHCKNGHKFDADNTFKLPSGGRRCRACHRVRDRAWRAGR